LTRKQPAFELAPGEPFPHLPRAPIAEAVIHWAARAGKELDRQALQQQLAERLPDYPKCQLDREATGDTQPFRVM
jgi:hypothetical protein